MTKAGKCDNCRKSKVKCDEVKPICGRCKRTRKQCLFSNSENSRFIGCMASNSKDVTAFWKSKEPNVLMTLKSSQRADAGGGLFQKFGSIIRENQNPTTLQSAASRINGYMIPPPGRRLDSVQTRIVSRWVSLVQSQRIGLDDSVIYVNGEWQRLIPQYITQSRAVAAAASCFLDSTVALVNATAGNHAVVQTATGKALGQLQTAIQELGSKSCGIDILLAIKLLFTSEVFIASQNLNWISHLRGYSSLILHSDLQHDDPEELGRHMFHGTFLSEANTAILLGEESIFLSSKWFKMPPPGVLTNDFPFLESAWKTAVQSLLRVTRLIKLVRRVREFPHEKAVRTEAAKLAVKLYQLDIESYVSELSIFGALSLQPTTIPEVAPFFPMSYNFSTIRIFHLLLTYWVTRTYTCGAIQTLYSLSHFPQSLKLLDLPSVENHDIQIAEKVAMCTQYALNAPYSIPALPMRLISVLQVSFGAWNRFSLRSLQLGEDKLDIVASQYTRATDMKMLCIWIIHQIEKKLKTSLHTNYEGLEVLTSTHAGGPVLIINYSETGPRTLEVKKEKHDLKNQEDIDPQSFIDG